LAIASSFSFFSCALTFASSYNTPVDALRAEFDRLVTANKLWDNRVKGIQVTDARQNCIELRVLVSARNSSHAFDLRCYIRENLIKFIKDNYPESLPLNRVVMNGKIGEDAVIKQS
jgi:hypothetical protein